MIPIRPPKQTNRQIALNICHPEVERTRSFLRPKSSAGAFRKAAVHAFPSATAGRKPITPSSLWHKISPLDESTMATLIRLSLSSDSRANLMRQSPASKAAQGSNTSGCGGMATSRGNFLAKVRASSSCHVPRPTTKSNRSVRRYPPRAPLVKKNRTDRYGLASEVRLLLMSAPRLSYAHEYLNDYL